MRILEISPYNFSRGGSDKYFIQISELLESAGHTVYKFCTRHPENDFTEESIYFPKGIDTHSKNPINALKLFYNFNSSKLLDKFLCEHKIEVAHVHIYYGQFTTSILHVLRKHKIPIVQTIHDYKPVCPVYSLNKHGSFCTDCEGTKFYKCIKNRCNRGSLARSVLSASESYFSKFLGSNKLIDRYIAVCYFQANTLKKFNISKQKISVLYNFADPIPVNNDQTNKRDSFLYFGRIEKSKGVFEMVEAFSKIQPNLQNQLQFIIAGDGSAFESLKSYVDENNFSQVKLVGHISSDELVEYANQSISSILVPNAIENCSMAVLESLAMSLPVITSKIGALPELVTDQFNGLEIQPGDVKKLTQCMELLATNDELVKKLRVGASQRVKSHFESSNHVQNIQEIFEDVIKNYHHNID